MQKKNREGSVKNFDYLRAWLTGEGYGPSYIPRPVILECIHSRSGLSMAVYDRGERIFTVNGCGFDRIGAALAEFLERLYQPELRELDEVTELGTRPGFRAYASHVSLDGACGVESMIKVADAIGLKVHQSESKAGTLLVIEKRS